MESLTAARLSIGPLPVCQHTHAAAQTNAAARSPVRRCGRSAAGFHRRAVSVGPLRAFTDGLCRLSATARLVFALSSEWVGCSLCGRVHRGRRAGARYAAVYSALRSGVALSRAAPGRCRRAAVARRSRCGRVCPPSYCSCGRLAVVAACVGAPYASTAIGVAMRSEPNGWGAPMVRSAAHCEELSRSASA